MKYTMQQTKLRLDDRRFIIEIMIQVATEKQCLFTEGMCRFFVCWANLICNYTARPQGLIPSVDWQNRWDDTHNFQICNENTWVAFVNDNKGH